MLAVAAARAHLSPAMPGRAADGGEVPFRPATEGIRAGVEGSPGGGGLERPGARGQRQDIVWRNVVLMSLLHLAAVYSLVLIPKAKPLTLLWGKSRRRRLRTGRRGESALGRAGSRVRCRVCGAASVLRSSPPVLPGLLGLQFPALWDEQVFLSTYFQLLPSPQSARAGAFASSLTESWRDPESCGATAVRRGARGETLGTGRIGLGGMEDRWVVVLPVRVPGILSATFQLLGVLSRASDAGAN